MLAGNIAFVTGGSRGIGAAICRALATEGAAVAVGYRSGRSRAESLVHEIERSGGRAASAGADLADPQAARAAFAEASARLGAIDILVLNAWPGWHGRPFERTEWSDFQSDFASMLRPAVELTRAALPSMRERRYGRIVLLGSTSMYELNPEHSAYVAAKGALLALTRSLASELGRHGITVNMVSPSLVWTGDGPEPTEFGAEHRTRNALGRLPTPEEVAAAVAFFAGPSAGAITGVHLPVTCGSPMHVG